MRWGGGWRGMKWGVAQDSDSGDIFRRISMERKLNLSGEKLIYRAQIEINRRN